MLQSVQVSLSKRAGVEDSFELIFQIRIGKNRRPFRCPAIIVEQKQGICRTERDTLCGRNTAVYQRRKKLFSTYGIELERYFAAESGKATELIRQTTLRTSMRERRRSRSLQFCKLDCFRSNNLAGAKRYACGDAIRCPRLGAGQRCFECQRRGDNTPLQAIEFATACRVRQVRTVEWRIQERAEQNLRLHATFAVVHNSAGVKEVRAQRCDKRQNQRHGHQRFEKRKSGAPVAITVAG